MTKRKTENGILSGVLWIISLFILIPVFMVVINSFKSRTEAAEMDISLPSEYHIVENYSQMMQEGGILRGLMTSCIVTTISVVALILICSAMAYVFQRRNTKMANRLSTLMVAGLVLPVQIIPTYFVCNTLHLGHMASAILVLIVINIPFTVFLYTGYLKSIPREIDEAAWIDGASGIQTFFQVIFPLLKPVSITALIINFMAVWNDFSVSIYFLNSAENYTLPLTVYNFFGNHGSDWQLVFANVAFASLPVVILYLLLQRHIIAGMTAGSVKG
ncbi:MAG: carbohydrate ABC transporter permease [Lachnospiraceae bacterium]|nr:carbohydrate ABC transporter permease [Lachnospiraceae bacterium]